MTKTKNREITIRFNADTSSSMTWSFRPQQREIKVAGRAAVDAGVELTIDADCKYVIKGLKRECFWLLSLLKSLKIRSLEIRNYR